MYFAIFPGQGSYEVGMGKDVYENFKISRHVFDSANEILGYPISKIIFNGPEEELTKAAHIQIAIFITCIALFKALEEVSKKTAKDIIHCTLGHSLGQYTALYIAGCLNLPETIKLIHARSIAMQKACNTVKGKMLACINILPSILEEIIQQAKQLGIIGIANYNSKSQIILSGEEKAILRSKELIQEKGLKCILLNVAGAFHTELMNEAACEFQSYLKSVNFISPAITVIDNSSAQPLTDVKNLNKILKNHITNPVLWWQSISYCINLSQGKELSFLEVGPKPVLSNMLKKDYPDINIYSISKSEDVENFAKTYLI